MLESLKIITEETLEVYNLATLDGRLFIPFVICCIYLLLSPAQEDDRARQYLVYPSLILFVFLFNPVLIHYLIKVTEDAERVVRLFWPLPMEGVFAYCIIRAFYALKKNRKRVVLLIASAFVLLLVSNGNHAGLSYTRAQNPEKLIAGVKEICDTIYTLSDGQETSALVPKHLFYWIRGYNAAILLPYVNDADEFMYDEDGNLDLNATGEKAREGECEYVVVSSSYTAVGALEDYGYTLSAEVPGDNCTYYIYRLT